MSMELLQELNPGFVMILAGFLSFLIRPAILRAFVTIGGPLLALILLRLYSDFSVDHGVISLMGIEMVTYRVDSLSFIFVLAFGIAAVLNSIYSLHIDDPLQEGCGLIYAGAAVAAAAAGDLLTIFIFWELTAISSVFLIWRSGTKAAYKAGMRYLAIQILSGVLLLFGATFYLQNHGDLHVRAISLQENGAWLIFIALGIKAAFPFLHNWLQDSYPKATPTGAVVLSAFTTKLAVYAFARLFPGEDILIYIGATMTIFPVFFAVIENDLRKVLSYSLNNQVGFMICAIGIGTPLAINGAAAHAFAHSQGP